jgi:DNA-binding transcriptional ArsR family regulator
MVHGPFRGVLLLPEHTHPIRHWRLFSTADGRSPVAGRLSGARAACGAFAGAKSPLTRGGAAYIFRYMTNYRNRAFDDALAIAKALADEQRLRILAALRGGELCLCQLVELLGLASSTVSKHASILRQARLIQARKDGRWAWFRLADAEDGSDVAGALAWAEQSLAGSPRIREDRARLKTILQMDPEEVCRNQCKS